MKIHIGKQHSKYIVIGLQVIILFVAVCSFLFHRGNPYSRNITIGEYTLSNSASVTETVSTNDSLSPEGIFLSSPPLSLKKGIYQVTVDYFTDCPGSTISASSDLGVMEFHSPSVELSPNCVTKTMTLELSRNSDDIVIHISFSGTGQISVSNIGVHETSYLYKRNLFYAALLCLLISIVYFFMHTDFKNRKIMLALFGIFLVSCYPLYNDFLIFGHDLPFHLLRIDAISQGLSQGIFPVKLHPLWANGYGYAVGIFYGDAFLYFPAILRLLGLSIQTSYKFFLAFINMVTILCSYYSFRKMFADDKIGLLGCLAYTLAPYRLMDLYTRAAVGEYCSLMVLPLVLCGFYMIFQNRDKNKWWKYSILTAFGLTGIIQSHVLSSLMVCFVIILTCLILVKQVFRQYIFRSLACAALLTLMLNLNFIVPFLDFYREDIMINSPEWTGRVVGSFQSGGLFPIQLFALYPRSIGGAWSATAGVSNEPSYSIGILLTIGLFTLLYLLCAHPHDCKNNRNYGSALLCASLSFLLLYMSTCYFPWDAVSSINDTVKNSIHSLQFPWRMLTPALALLTFVLCYSFNIAKKTLRNYYSHFITGSLILLILNSGWYLCDFSFSSEAYRIYNTSELYTMQMYSYDYLPRGTDPGYITENLLYSEGVSPLESFHKEGNTISCSVTAICKDAYVDLPLLYYKYYRCTDLNTLQRLPVCAGTNNMVRVLLPEGYSGSIEVRFVEPWFWRLSEIISALTFFGVIVILLPFRKARNIDSVRLRESA